MWTFFRFSCVVFIFICEMHHGWGGVLCCCSSLWKECLRILVDVPCFVFARGSWSIRRLGKTTTNYTFRCICCPCTMHSRANKHDATIGGKACVYPVWLSLFCTTLCETRFVPRQKNKQTKIKGRNIHRDYNSTLGSVGGAALQYRGQSPNTNTRWWQYNSTTSSKNGWQVDTITFYGCYNSTAVLSGLFRSGGGGGKVPSLTNRGISTLSFKLLLRK